MDNIIRDNRERWDELASVGVMHSQPYLDYTPEKAAEYVYQHNILSDVKDQEVLCLASGGGQNSVAFALLGAHVTVQDLSEVQLSRDCEAALHYGFHVDTVQGDMRDLSVLPDNQFDVVWQPYSLNYSPEVESVFTEVARVLKPGGIYHVTFANPFTQALDGESWNGTGYLLRGLYADGEDISKYYPYWDVEQADGSTISVKRPHEFRHNLGTVMNSMAKNGFVFLHLQEWTRHAENFEPGSWPHFTQTAPPWFDSFWRLGSGE